VINYNDTKKSSDRCDIIMSPNTGECIVNSLTVLNA
jgi:hypothetical protein